MSVVPVCPVWHILKVTHQGATPRRPTSSTRSSSSRPPAPPGSPSCSGHLPPLDACPWKSASRSYHRLVYPQVSWTLPHPRSPTSCTAWFTLEAIVRFIACPSKIDFWKDFKNIVDVTADVRNIQVRVQDGAVSSTVSAAPKRFDVARVFLGVKRNAPST